MGELYVRLCVFISSFEVMVMGGELMFCHYHRYRAGGRKRLGAGLVLYFVMPVIWTFLLPIRSTFLYMPFFRIGNWFYSGYLIYFLFSILIILCCYEIDIWHALFYGSAAYIVQHLRYGSMELISRVVFQGDRTSIAANTVCLFCTFLLFAGTYFLMVKKVRQNETIMIDNKWMSVFACIAIVVINIWNMYINEYNLNNLGTNGYLVVSCLLLLFIQFGLFEHRKLLSDKQLIEGLLLNVDKQRQYSAQNIELINRKCHDLKYQIAAMRGMDRKQQDATIDELEKAVMFYDRNYKTGNPTLDTILTEKTLLCEKHEIEFTCIVEGKCMNFMEPVDLYSLLGNALDNAIEGVKRETGSDRKIITLNIARKENLVSICLINVCRHEVRFKDGLPVTVKENREEHGFGTRNMAYLVEKYGGSFRMQHKEGMFETDILFPVTENDG